MSTSTELITGSTIGAQRLWSLLQELPPYAMATLTWRGQEYELMARDLPGKGRRMTCLTTGTEWFITDELLATMQAEITHYTIRCGGRLR